MPSTLINAPESRQSVQNQEGLSRRARRELERDRSRPKILRPFARIARKVGSPTTVISRMALVGALAGIAVVIPVQGGLLPGDATLSLAAHSAPAEPEAVTELSGPSTVVNLSAEAAAIDGS